MAKLYVHGQVKREFHMGKGRRYRLMSDGKWLVERSSSHGWKLSKINAEGGDEHTVADMLIDKGYTEVIPGTKISEASLPVTGKVDDSPSPASSTSSGNPSGSGSSTTTAPHPMETALANLKAMLAAAKTAAIDLQVALNEFPDGVEDDEWYGDLWTASGTIATFELKVDLDALKEAYDDEQ